MGAKFRFPQLGLAGRKSERQTDRSETCRRKDRWFDGWKGRQTDGRTNGRTETGRDRKTDGHTERRMDGPKDGWTDRWTGGRTDKQSECVNDRLLANLKIIFFFFFPGKKSG